ncbi:hypothetical protein FRC02_005790 [Tulasnella sp. 418]|nr:hypothetical protein FRC02_005790 [Tulasnella sp. 418]
MPALGTRELARREAIEHVHDMLEYFDQAEEMLIDQIEDMEASDSDMSIEADADSTSSSGTSLSLQFWHSLCL